MLNGREGYQRRASLILDCADHLRKNITNGIPELEVIGDNKLHVVCFILLPNVQQVIVLTMHIATDSDLASLQNPIHTQSTIRALNLYSNT